MVERGVQQQQHQVLLGDLTWVIEVALVIAFATAIHLVRRGSITVATLAHALSLIFLVFTSGHFIEVHVIGIEAVEELVRTYPTAHYRNGRILMDWFKAAVLSITAFAALGKGARSEYL